jgi:predicted esterase YcpF (UPF0227 family)
MNFMKSKATITHLLYLHGFRSSPQSVKAQKLTHWVGQLHPQVHWWCPQLPPSPQEAMTMILQGTKDWPLAQTAVIGSSLGGFYAHCFAIAVGCRAVLLNPAVEPASDLIRHVGLQQAWHDPAQSFYFQSHYVDELKSLQDALKEALQIASEAPRNEIFAIVAKGDEVLDWREMTSHLPHARIKLLSGSDHALSDFEAHQHDILNFLSLA